MAKKPNKQMGEKVSLGYAWYALFVLFMINLVNYVDRLSIGPAMENIKRNFSATDAEMGLIAGSFMLVYAVLSLPMGYLSDKGKRTRIVALGAAVWSIATTLSGFCRNFTSFFFARAAVGAGEGIYAPSGTAIVSDYFPKRLRNTSIAIFMSAMIVGGAMAYIVAGLILQKTEHFDTAVTELVLVDEGQKEIAGWTVEGVKETDKRHVEFSFKNESGEVLTATLSRMSEKKEADFKSKLFNVDYDLGEKELPEEFTQDAKEFVLVLNDRISEREGVIEREGSTLERSTAIIQELPHAFVIDEVVSEDKKGKEYSLKLSDDVKEAAKKGAWERIADSLDGVFGGELHPEDADALSNEEIMAKYVDRLHFYEGEKEITNPNPIMKAWDSASGLFGGAEEELTEKRMVFYGIMTKEDRMALDQLSDNESYSKSIGMIQADSKYHFVKSDNWKWIFWILGPPGLIFAMMAFFLKEPLKGGSEDFLSEEEARRIEEDSKVNYWILLKTPSIVFMIFSNILATFCVGGLNTWLFPFVERYKGVESATAAVQFGPIVVLFAVLGVIISGMMADKLQKITPRGNNMIIVAGILLGIPPMYLFLHSDSYYVMVASISLCIFFLTWINGPMNALLMSLVEPRLRAMLNGVHILLIHLLGDAISPFIIGHQSDINGLGYALSLLPYVLLLGAVGFAIAGIFVPKDLKAVEERMKSAAGGAPIEDSGPPMGH